MINPLLDALSAKTPNETADVLVTWVGGITLLRYRLAIARRTVRSPLERRTGFLISTLALHLLLRGFSWLNPDTVWLGVIALMPATLLPLAMTIFAEGLLRRHVPSSIKWLAVVATTVSFTTNIVTGFWHRESDIASRTQLVTLALTMAVLGVVLIRRNRQSLSRAENALVNTCTMVAVVGLPLVATDFRFVLGWPPVRLGTLAALLLCYTLLRRLDERHGGWLWVRDVLLLATRGAVIAGVLLLAIRSTPFERVPAFIVLTIALVFALAVDDRLTEHSRRRPIRELLRWIARPAASSVADFSREVRHLALTSDARVLGEADLAPYHVEALRTTLAGRGAVRSLSELRDLRHGHDDGARGADELTDLLDRTGMSHAALVTDRPLRLLLVNMPELPGSDETLLALSAIVRHGQLAAMNEQQRLGAL